MSSSSLSPSQASARAPFPVIVHPYPSSTPHSCAYELVVPNPYLSGASASIAAPTAATSPQPRNALVFLAGLGDGPHTVPYIRAVAAGIAGATGAAPLDYSVFEVRMFSSFDGFGSSSLKKDVQDVDGLVRYLRGLGKEKIVLLGHSTGCQDCMEYSDYEKHGSSPVDGFILQGPVSDREGLAPIMGAEKMQESVAHAAQLIKEGKGESIMPREALSSILPSPITAYRWHSLASTGGDDDYFSSDLPDQKVAEVWGRIQKPVLVVPSEKDEHVPENIDFEKLLTRWKGFCRPGVFSELSGIIPGASHRVKGAESQDWLADRVVKFLQSLEGEGKS